MSQTLPAPVDYLAFARFERETEGRHELEDGRVVAMSGGTPAHARLPMNLAAALYPQLGSGPCAVYSGDLRIYVEATANSYYPDLTVVCGEVALHPHDDHALVNPAVLVEVLSPSSAMRDRGRKGPEYRTLPSLQDLLFVAQDRRHVEHWQRVEVGWRVVELTAGTLVLACGAEVALDALYAGVA
ncbi:MAG: Uma2 family endonuclease [Myxococcales bacterium]|nr:Uma2 family endonuclease [Myxococcales bacterium]